jgi:hypothetical protein
VFLGKSREEFINLFDSEKLRISRNSLNSDNIEALIKTAMIYTQGYFSISRINVGGYLY